MFEGGPWSIILNPHLCVEIWDANEAYDALSCLKNYMYQMRIFQKAHSVQMTENLHINDQKNPPNF